MTSQCRQSAGTEEQLAPVKRKTNPWNDAAIEERFRKIDAIQARERRLKLVEILRRQGATGMSHFSEAQLTEAANSHSRALQHQRDADKHYRAATSHLHDIATAHAKLAAKLKESDVSERTYAALKAGLDALKEYLDRARDCVESSADCTVNVGRAIDKASHNVLCAYFGKSEYDIDVA
jgi:hypothetical protein